ncbi:MAG TPA: PocR ligand-binding domain-containing protein [Kiritimatiellia bacterium]|nr:PocR ligand-binding domain-containing protein [Kiritimatiellia bacterium]
MDTAAGCLVAGKYAFTELIAADRLRELFESFVRVSGLAARLVSLPDHEIIASSGWSDICSRFHRSNTGSEALCLANSRRLAVALNGPLEPSICVCENGLVAAAEAVWVKGVHVANLYAGQILFEKPDIARFKKQAEAFSYDVNAYLESLSKVPVVPESSFREALSFLGHMVVLHAEQGYAELQARENAEKFRSLAENAVDYIFIKDRSRRYTFVNRAFQQLLGRSESEILGKTPLEIYGPESARIVEEVDDRTFAGESVDETRKLMVGGREYYFQTAQAPLARKDGEVISIMGIVHNVTTLHLAEESLRENNARTAAMLAAMPEMVFVLAADGTYMDFKADREDELAIPPREFIGKKIGEAMFDEDQVRFILEQIQITLKTGRVHSFEYKLRRRAFDEYFDARLAPFGPDKVLATVRNITYRKNVEEELQTMERLKSIGVLAGGLAHDFNNILMGLYGNLALAREMLPSGSPACAPLEEAEKSMERATGLTRQLLTFAKGGAPVREHVRLDNLVKNISAFNLAGSSVKLVFEEVQNLWCAEVDRSQMQQVFSNLIINAVQAMPNGGNLFVGLLNLEVGPDDIPGLTAGKYVKISLRDEGVGIGKKDMARIFDPFYTTKQTGTGLGLATAYSIVSRHGGHISVESELRKGTVFDIYLPVSSAQEPEKTLSASDQKGAAWRAARVLVMDDDPAICRIVVRMLQEPSREVEVAPDGQKAIELCRTAVADGQPYDVVIMDLTIPGGMGGMDAIGPVREIIPGIKAIVSSGYADDAVMSNFTEYGFNGVIAKPYTKPRLLQVLDQVMRE